MPTNLYGPGDNFHPENSHVLPALLRRFHEAKSAGQQEVLIWGTGNPRREFLHVDDLAEGALFILDLPHDVYRNCTDDQLSHINIGSGSDISIRDLAEMVAEVTDFSGSIRFDDTKPDGTMRKLMDSGRLNNLGWSPRIQLRAGIKETYEWYVGNLS